jgi:predicted NBD/HSP70 family sugar kinase
VGGANAADGSLVRTLARAGELIDHQRFESCLGQEEGCWKSYASCTDDNGVIDFGSHLRLYLLIKRDLYHACYVAEI